MLDDFYRGLSAALVEAKGPRTSRGRARRQALGRGRGAARRAKPAAATPAVSAVLVRLDLEIGLAADAMRATLATPRARALLEEGLRALGAHLVKDLLKG